MPVPDRPVEGAEIETEWGQEIHDRVITPKGCRTHGTSTTLSGTSSVQMDLSTGDDDPGGWLDATNDRLVVPSGADGVYDWKIRATSTSGNTGTSVRLYLMLNGSEIARAQEDCDTGVQITINPAIDVDLTAGDVLTVRAQRIGSTPAPQVTVARMTLHRWGDEFGA